MTTNATVPPTEDDLAAQLQIHLAYESVVTGLQFALSEIAAENRLPVSARRMTIKFLLTGLPTARKLELAGQLVDLGEVFVAAEALYDLEDNPAVSNLHRLADTAAHEVLAVAGRAYAAHQQLTGGVR
jgi:hypothetical protein